MARIIMTRAAAWPAPEAPFPPQALELARQRYDAIERRLDELGRPPRPDVPCAPLPLGPGRGSLAGDLRHLRDRRPGQRHRPVDRRAAAQLYAMQDANKQKKEQALFNLAGTLGMLGLGGLGAFGGFGYAR